MKREFRTLVQGPFLENSWHGFVSNLLLFHCFDKCDDAPMSIKCLVSPSQALVPDSVGKVMEVIYGKTLLRVSSNIESLAAQFEGQLVLDSWERATAVVNSHWVSGVIGLDQNPGLFNMLSNAVIKFHSDHWTIQEIIAWSMYQLASCARRDRIEKILLDPDYTFIFPERLDAIAPALCKAWAEMIKQRPTRRAIVYFPAPPSLVVELGQQLGKALAEAGIDPTSKEVNVDVISDPLGVEELSYLILNAKVKALPMDHRVLEEEPDDPSVHLPATLCEAYWRNV